MQLWIEDVPTYIKKDDAVFCVKDGFRKCGNKALNSMQNTLISLNHKLSNRAVKLRNLKKNSVNEESCWERLSLYLKRCGRIES